MAKYYDGPMDRDTDWGNVLDPADKKFKPASGMAVQKYIKEVFDKKAGIFYMDPTNNRYLVFADETTRDKYLMDPTQTHLILGAFDAPFNYSASIHLITPSYVSILRGTTGNHIEFTFDTFNKAGESMREAVNATFTFMQAGKKTVMNQRYQPGETVKYNIDKYLSEGTTLISISITGLNTMAATSIGVQYDVVYLTLTDSLDISKPHDNTKVDAILDVPYSVYGSGVKTMSWYIDGEKLPFNRTEDEILTIEANRTKSISINALAPGRHSVQFKVSMNVNGVEFDSYTLYRDFFVSQQGHTNLMIGLGFTIPKGLDPLTDTLVIRGAEQFKQYDIAIATYSPTSVAKSIVDILVDTVVEGSLSTTNDQVYTFNYKPVTAGTKAITFKSGTIELSGTVIVEKTTTSLREITDNLTLALDATGRSNDEANPAVWKYGSIMSTFKGFKWDARSGWNNGSLTIAEGSSLEIAYQPYITDITRTGFTLEMELSTTHVLDDSSPILDMRNAKGVGIYCTSTMASITASNGTTLSIRYKSEEVVRVAFVVNTKTGHNKLLVLVYINGVCSGSIPYSSLENFVTNKAIIFGNTANTTILLKSIRAYARVLSSDEILNNYMLYRSTVAEMISIYDDNDIYDKSTGKISMDAMVGKLPVMLVTGNIPVLENTTDKNETIYVNIDYIDLSDSSKSFTSKGTRMRPQGTSSMSYPKKNFRIYLNYGTLYDSKGAIVVSGKYSFKDKAQPVSTFCLKADYAESSSTHNTGIARIWNKAMTDAVVDNQPVLRTEAQKAAIDAKYPYDVRTTIDGFPIAMFYRLNETSEVIFLGKYNFNNDKSTESVFGFTDIPGFDNSKVHCWEILNNGNALALFKTMDGFDEGWADAYESRYPDGGTDVTELKKVSAWLVSTRVANDVTYSGNIEVAGEVKADSDATYKNTLGGAYIANGSYPDNATNRNRKFQREKWDYLDVFKMAAYYCYIMRFGAVDQTVKNAMFTTEGTKSKGTKSKWFFINYDNDTINGVRNDGRLSYNYDIDRQTIDPSFQTTTFAYAGHESTLWNNLEADEEFMAVVNDIDNALYQAGLSYQGVVDMFETNQSERWCERVYNLDADYKYIGPYNEGVANNLYMLQGSRKSHRRFWISKRFDILDSKFGSGRYRSKVIELKVGNAPAGIKFSIVSGNKDIYYGFGVNNVLKSKTPTPTPVGHSVEFTTDQVLNIGDPLRIYSAPNLKEVDLSGFTQYLSTLSITGITDVNIGSQLDKLVVGHETNINNGLTGISGLALARNLKTLDVRGLKALTSLELSENIYLETLVAANSGVKAAVFAKASPLKSVILPDTLESISLDNISTLTSDNLAIGGFGKNLSNIQMLRCTGLDTFKFIKDWLVVHTASLSSVNISLTGLDWRGVNVDDLISLGRIKDEGANLNLKGRVKLISVNTTHVAELRRLFGGNCFTPQSDFWISAPDAVYVTGPDKVYMGDNVKYDATVFSEKYGTVEFGIVYNGQYYKDTVVNNMRMNSLTGELTTLEPGTSPVTFKVRVTHRPTAGQMASVEMDVELLLRIYPDYLSTLTPDREHISSIGDTIVIFTPKPDGVNGLYELKWAIVPVGGEVIDPDIVSITSSDKTHCVITTKTQPILLQGFQVKCEIVKTNGQTLLTTIYTQMTCGLEGVILSRVQNPTIMDICYEQGWCLNPDYMTKDEAAAVTSLGTAFSGKRLGELSRPRLFPELKYFTGLSDIQSAFRYTQITYRPGLSDPSAVICIPPQVSDMYLAFQGAKVYNYPLNPSIVPRVWADIIQYEPSEVPLTMVSTFQESMIYGIIPSMKPTEYTLAEGLLPVIPDRAIVINSCLRDMFIDFVGNLSKTLYVPEYIVPKNVESAITSFLGTNKSVYIKKIKFQGGLSKPLEVSLDVGQVDTRYLHSFLDDVTEFDFSEVGEVILRRSNSAINPGQPTTQPTIRVVGNAEEHTKLYMQSKVLIEPSASTSRTDFGFGENERYEFSNCELHHFNVGYQIGLTEVKFVDSEIKSVRWYNCCINCARLTHLDLSGHTITGNCSNAFANTSQLNPEHYPRAGRDHMYYDSGLRRSLCSSNVFSGSNIRHVVPIHLSAEAIPDNAATATSIPTWSFNQWYNRAINLVTATYQTPLITIDEGNPYRNVAMLSLDNFLAGCEKLVEIELDLSNILCLRAESFATGCISLVTASGLKFTIGEAISPERYTNISFKFIFKGCISLRYLPDITNTITTASGYGNNMSVSFQSMYHGCVAITTPEFVLPNTLNCNYFSYTNTYEGCTGIVGRLYITHEAIFAFGSGTFKGCSGITGVVATSLIPAVIDNTSRRVIPDHMFNGCTGLETVAIDTYGRYVGIEVFRDCPKLRSVVLNYVGPTPGVLLTILSKVFYSCAKLCDLRFIGFGSFSTNGHTNTFGDSIDNYTGIDTKVSPGNKLYVTSGSDIRGFNGTSLLKPDQCGFTAIETL